MDVKDGKVEKSCAAEMPERSLRVARVMLLFSLLKRLVPCYLNLEIDEISQFKKSFPSNSFGLRDFM